MSSLASQWGVLQSPTQEISKMQLFHKETVLIDARGYADHRTALFCQSQLHKELQKLTHGIVDKH
jgi:hypothetical protein